MATINARIELPARPTTTIGNLPVRLPGPGMVLIAVEKDSDTFELFMSEEAASPRRVYDRLAAILANGGLNPFVDGGWIVDRSIGGSTGGSPSRADSMPGDVPIYPRPVFSDLSPVTIGWLTAHPVTHVLYLVRGDAIEIHVPVWADPDVLSPFNTHLEVAVVATEAAPALPEPPLEWADVADAYADVEPVCTLGPETVPAGQPPVPAAADILREYHQCLLAGQLVMAQGEAHPAGPTHAPGLLTTADYHFLVSAPEEAILSATYGQGPLVRVDDLEDVAAVHRVASRHRYAAGVELATGEAEDGSTSQWSLVPELLDATPGMVSALTPSPYGSA